MHQKSLEAVEIWRHSAYCLDRLTSVSLLCRILRKLWLHKYIHDYIPSSSTYFARANPRTHHHLFWVLDQSF